MHWRQMQKFDPYDLLMTLKKRSQLQAEHIKNLETAQIEIINLIRQQTETIALLQESLRRLKDK